jgi:D-3-phosphoglycerate dehydrogenase / 2-oxoglutarate reductase
VKRVLTLSTFEPETMRRLEDDPDFIVGWDTKEVECLAGSGAIVGIVVRSSETVDRSMLVAMPALRFVIRAGNGLDNIDVEELHRRNIALIRNPNLSAEAVAELALGGILSLVRRIPEAMGLLRQGTWAKNRLIGESLSQLNVAIWGGGPIGLACYRILRERCAGIRFASWPSLPDEVRHLSVVPDELSLTSDIHLMCLPARPETIGLFGEAFIRSVRRCRPYLVNVGRYELLDTAKAIRALKLGHLRGLFIDPINSEDVAELAQLLRGSEDLNVIVTQHLGAQRVDVSAAMGEWVIRTAKELIRKLEVA